MVDNRVVAVKLPAQILACPRDIQAPETLLEFETPLAVHHDAGGDMGDPEWLQPSHEFVLKLVLARRRRRQASERQEILCKAVALDAHPPPSRVKLV
jgi:hypothetical protein